MTDKINVTYLYKGFTEHHPEFLPEHQGSGFTGDFTDEDIELEPIAYFFNDNIAEKTRIALNHELADQDIEDERLAKQRLDQDRIAALKMRPGYADRGIGMGPDDPGDVDDLYSIPST